MASKLTALAFEKDMFQKFSVRQIRDFFHQEKGYQHTKDGATISFQYAQESKNIIIGLDIANVV